ncbi:aminopeptidase P family N-terminal domain-containing protein, partial [Rhizobium ruizarguesonis]
ILVWEEEDSSAALIARLVAHGGRLALDYGLPLFFYHALAAEMGAARLADVGRLIRDLRCIKSAADIALIQYAMNLTLDVHR